MKTTITSLFAAALLALAAAPGAVSANTSLGVYTDDPAGGSSAHIRFSTDELPTGPRR